MLGKVSEEAEMQYFQFQSKEGRVEVVETIEHPAVSNPVTVYYLVSTVPGTLIVRVKITADDVF